ncbi:MAG: RHS repeat-associated core domain-containing protein [Bacteroidales bacterium]
MYDPIVGRFLSPDNYVQAPDYTQSFNRYSYVWNNPLKYTDPSGEFVVLDSWLTGFVHGFFSTSKGRWKAGWKEANLRAGNDAKIWGGLFVTDPNKSDDERVCEPISRFTWQLPQTTGGFYTSHAHNTYGFRGGVESVDYAYRATVKTDIAYWKKLTGGYT